MQLEIGKNKNIRHPDNTTTVNKSEQDYKSNYLVREKGWEACKSGKYMQRGPPPKHFLSPNSHILDSNGMWYSHFDPRSLINHLYLTILISKFVHGTSRGGAGVRGTALFYCFLQLSYFLPTSTIWIIFQIFQPRIFQIVDVGKKMEENDKKSAAPRILI